MLCVKRKLPDTRPHPLHVRNGDTADVDRLEVLGGAASSAWVLFTFFGCCDEYRGIEITVLFEHVATRPHSFMVQAFVVSY